MTHTIRYIAWSLTPEQAAAVAKRAGGEALGPLTDPGLPAIRLGVPARSVPAAVRKGRKALDDAASREGLPDAGALTHVIEEA